MAKDPATNALAGFITRWVDENSKSALLEPIARLPEYRRRGVASGLISYGPGLMKEKGIRYVHVSTSIDHGPVVSLYERMGFMKSGEACLYLKCK
ncbi:MAG: GNAT family N-acetyltransferase [Clostridiales bacterium]|nr:GNAT family N-acetyltransferase [Clostridiales bacterium]